jgi:hypothetical protein
MEEKFCVMKRFIFIYSKKKIVNLGVVFHSDRIGFKMFQFYVPLYHYFCFLVYIPILRFL